MNWLQCTGCARNRGAGPHCQRCRRHCCRSSRYARPARQTHSRMDHRKRHRLRALALRGWGLGGWAHHRHTRPQRALLRMRRRRPPRGHHGPPRHAHALPRPGAGRSLCQCQEGDARCREFVDLWHRALAAATSSFIHLAGPGRFYFTGSNVGFLDLEKLRSHLETMVRMSPLQSYSLEILPPDDETALIGAGVSA